MYPKVSIIIHNWNGWKDNIYGFKSLYLIKYAYYGAFLINNSSKNILIEIIKYKFLEQDPDNSNLINDAIRSYLYSKIRFDVHLVFIMYINFLGSGINGCSSIFGCYFHKNHNLIQN